MERKFLAKTEFPYGIPFEKHRSGSDEGAVWSYVAENKERKLGMSEQAVRDAYNKAHAATGGDQKKIAKAMKKMFKSQRPASKLRKAGERKALAPKNPKNPKKL